MIPKIIHICWLSGEPYPPNIQKCLDSWKKILPEYRIMLWDTNRFDINRVSWTEQAFGKKKYAAAADYIRFYALYLYGGIYLDSDVEVIKSFDDLLNQKYFFGYEYTGVPEAAVIGAEKGCEWIRICREWYETRDYNDYSDSKSNIIAPLVLQYGYEKYSGIQLIDDGKVRRYKNGSIYPYTFFSPKNGFTGDIARTDESYTIHHFNSAWLNTTSLGLKIKRGIHMFLIKTLGKNRYNLLLYRHRKNAHRTD